ncbi:hypothetical protein [Paenibacillus agilis]|uniref:HD family phosphohydrolase n=1 Tax=Paenibacillus agilis TaxID=3020863 RepID=A0A559J379_9BACL|nr:hypothetical protein [Paenibacillus agilis]TVX94337.1 hypothetical protein FPZ44_15530 [Paenibacillus agilis]
MDKFLWIYFGVQALLLLVLLVVARFKDRRYRKESDTDVPDGYERTSEVSIDPRTGQKIRVYYNSRTGERFYKAE